jgi:peptidoglycan/LPS O-acetylase OafA/YrhL
VLLLLRFKQSVRKPLYRYPDFALLIAAICLLLRMLRSATLTFDYGSHLFPTHFRIDTLVIGTLLAYYHTFYPAAFSAVFRQRWVASLLASILLLALGIYWRLEDYFFAQTFGLSCLAFGYALLVGLSVEWEEKFTNCSWTSPGGTVGRNSYSIYLWHMAVADCVLRGSNAFPELPFPIWLLAYAAGSLLLGALLTRLVEEPFLRLRSRVSPQRLPVHEPKPSLTEQPALSYSPRPPTGSEAL